MGSRLQDINGLRIAVEGCGHGTLNAIYVATEKASSVRGWPGVDLLIIGGDFQAVRNPIDLNVMSVPAKFRELGDFHEYYSGARNAPYLTIFVGGNHEASSHLWELYYGGWVAPNIYYMGAANVLRLGPVRIAGMTGIWKGYNYNKSHHERLPYNQDDMKSIYHIRELDVRKLLQIRTQVDIGISHDWPRAIEKSGDARALWRMKPDFEQESKDGTLGNQAAAYVMDRLRPPYWFSAHMHCKFAATKVYQDAPDAAAASIAASIAPSENIIVSAPVSNNGATAHNEDEIDLDMDDDDDEGGARVQTATITTEAPSNPTESSVPDAIRALLPASFSRPSPFQKAHPGQPVPPAITNKTVRFLALDKCLPGRKFLQLLDVIPAASTSPNASTNPTSTQPQQTSTEPETKCTQEAPVLQEGDADISATPFQPRYKLSYDPEWLSITRAMSSLLIMGDRSASTPLDQGEPHYLPLITAAESWVEENIIRPGKLTVPENFVTTAPTMQEWEMRQGQDGGEEERGWGIGSMEQPREYSSPQTEAYCDLLGIENLFKASDEERRERVVRGPDPGEARRDSGAFGGGRGRGRGRGGGNKGRGGFDRGRGRGGRGRW